MFFLAIVEDPKPEDTYFEHHVFKRPFNKRVDDWLARGNRWCAGGYDRFVKEEKKIFLEFFKNFSEFSLSIFTKKKRKKNFFS